jgi:hypothetical protein
MVRTGAFELHLLVNGVKQAELVGSNRIAYVESRFDSLATYNVTKREKDPYGEEYDQAWPVTPYTLKITNHSGDMAYCKARVSPDGRALALGCACTARACVRACVAHARA